MIMHIAHRFFIIAPVVATGVSSFYNKNRLCSFPEPEAVFISIFNFDFLFRFLFRYLYRILFRLIYMPRIDHHGHDQE